MSSGTAKTERRGKKPKFRVGQVVVVVNAGRAIVSYGCVKRIHFVEGKQDLVAHPLPYSGKAILDRNGYWYDAPRAEAWSWYHESELRSLTAREAREVMSYDERQQSILDAARQLRDAAQRFYSLSRSREITPVQSPSLTAAHNNARETMHDAISKFDVADRVISAEGEGNGD